MRVSPLCPELPPATTCELMVIAPSDMAVQLLRSAPSARLKSSEAVSVPEPPLVVQVTATFVMFAEPTVPVPLRTRGGLARRLGEDGHGVCAAACEFRREGEGAAGGDGQVVAAVILQYQGSGQSQDRAADRIRHGRVSCAGHCDGCDVRRAEGAGAAADRAGLARWLGEDGYRVCRAAGQLRREGEGAVRGDGQVVAAVVLQYQGSGQPKTVPPTEYVTGGLVVQVTGNVCDVRRPSRLCRCRC